MEIFGAVEVERECLLLCEEKKQVMPPPRLFWDYKKTASRRNLFSLSFSLGVPFE
jgi:hypothetical protein